ncbi:MAG: radical SAM family heme chaperone HemW [Alphaproteobacteria bacterium]|nr:radical SAM family heme chaperone HemW [Alphaproteobacteria bacterium]
MNDITNDLSIYFHWPFCRSKCPYCDFFSQVKKNIPQDEIIADYLKQLEAYAAMLPNRSIVSVFFGGGTPSLIKPKNIETILNKISKLWPTSSNTEISLEANPNTQTPTLFSDLHQAGINRLSLGVQSLDDKELKFLGRTHTAADALQAIDGVLKIFDNHSIDLIYALPEQTVKNWQTQLELVKNFGLKHISLYQLTIEDGTIFAKKGIKTLDEETAALFYQLTESSLKEKNYQKYEVSNYALPGFESKHNRAYWIGQDYIGIGTSAHGRIKKDNIFYAQTNPLKLEELTPQERAEELIIMGLRLTDGIDKQRFEQISGLKFDSFINQNFKQTALASKLLEETASTLKATSDGFLVLDYLITNLCC